MRGNGGSTDSDNIGARMLGIGAFGLAAIGTGGYALAGIGSSGVLGAIGSEASTAGRLAWKGLQWFGREMGKDFLWEVGKEAFVNRDDLSNMDLFDITTSTLASKFKLNLAGKILIESFGNSAIDVSWGKGVESIANGKKSMGDFGVDALFEMTKTGLNETFNVFGENVIRESIIDVAADELKKYARSRMSLPEGNK